MVCRRISTSIARQFIRNNIRHPVTIALIRRPYASKAPGSEPKLHPLSGPIPGELDPRFGDLPDWNVPAINRQDLTETPAQPYDDKQGRRYYNEPVPEEDEILSVFSPDVHNQATLGFALKWFVGFAAVFVGMCYLVTYTLPGKIAIPKTFPYNGLQRELTSNNPARPDRAIDQADVTQ